MRTKMSFLVAALIAAACQDHHLPTAPPVFLIQDAVHNNGVQGFYWLPPMVPEPTFTGTFNATLSPSVTIDELVDATPDPDCGRLVTTFDMNSGPGSETIRVNTTDEYYIVNWHANDAEFAVRSECHYRIRARVEFGGQSLVLGIADVDVVSNGKELKNVATGEYIGLVDGRTLPIKFRAEQVMSAGNVEGLCTAGLDCVVGVIGDGGGTVVTPEERAGVFVPDAALDDGETRLIVIEERGSPCFPSSLMGLPQFTECFSIESFPSNVYGDGNVATLEDNITVGLCVEAAGLSESQLKQLQVYRLDTSPDEGEDPVQALQNVSASFLSCEETRTDQDGEVIGAAGLLPSVLSRVAAFLSPRPLHAATVLLDFGVGGSSTETSLFTWSIPAEMAINDGNNQTAAPEEAVGTAPSVIVTDTGGGSLSGVTVTFTVAEGNGSLTEPTTVVTGTDGIARVGGWTLPGTPGTYSITASSPEVDGSPVTFTATGAAAAGFAETGSLATGRQFHAAVRIGDDVLILGGVTGGFTTLASVERYSTAAGSFTTVSSMGSQREQFAAAVLESGSVLATGGLIRVIEGPTIVLASAERYDPVTNTWEPTGAMVADRWGHRATTLDDGRILITGGAGASGAILASAEVYDPETNGFSAVGSMAFARVHHTATLLPDGKVLIAGGFAVGGAVAQAELFDPVENVFDLTGSLNVARLVHAAASLPDGSVLLTGGGVTTSTESSAEIYSPTTGSFALTGSMSVPRLQHTATLLANGTVLVAGGADVADDVEVRLASAEVFNPTTGTFTSAGTMTAGARARHTSTLLSTGKALIVGGQGTTAVLQSAELFTPSP